MQWISYPRCIGIELWFYIIVRKGFGQRIYFNTNIFTALREIKPLKDYFSFLHNGLKLHFEINVYSHFKFSFDKK